MTESIAAFLAPIVSIAATLISAALSMPSRTGLLKDISIYAKMAKIGPTDDEAFSLRLLRVSIDARLEALAYPHRRRLAIAAAVGVILAVSVSVAILATAQDGRPGIALSVAATIAGIACGCAPMAVVYARTLKFFKNVEKSLGPREDMEPERVEDEADSDVPNDEKPDEREYVEIVHEGIIP